MNMCNSTQTASDLNLQLVTIKDGHPVTTSLDVARVFGKRHDSVLRTIQELECSDDFRLHNFVESS